MGWDGSDRLGGLSSYREVLLGWLRIDVVVDRQVLVALHSRYHHCGHAPRSRISAGVKGGRFYRVIWFLPGIAPIAAVSVFWSLAFQPTSGVVDAALGHLGLGSTHAWLSSSSLAIYPIVFVTVWASAGFAFIVLLSGMEQIPVEFYEAARLDGASWTRVFRSIMLPLVRPVIGVVALLEAIWTFNGFTVIWGMTQGGPGYATSTLPGPGLPTGL